MPLSLPELSPNVGFVGGVHCVDLHLVSDSEGLGFRQGFIFSFFCGFRQGFLARALAYTFAFCCLLLILFLAVFRLFQVWAAELGEGGNICYSQN